MVRFNLLRYDTFEPKKNSQKMKSLFFIGVLFVFILVFISLGLTFRVSRPNIKQESLQPLQKKAAASVKEDIPLIEVAKRVKRGDTIINTLKREGVDHQSAYKFFTDVKPVYNLRKIVAGQKYTLFLSSQGKEIKKFRYEINANQYLKVFKDERNNCFSGKIITIPYKVKKELIEGVITYSLFESILDCGERAELADILASLYEYDVDFNRDIRPNDSFSVIVEKKYLQGKFVRYGHVLAAEFINRGKVIQVIRYTDPEGKTAYYHPDGRAVRKMFLRCPLPFMRVTSRYGNRLHPVLGFSARHNGIDFGAPVGTKIRASASGVIQRISYNRSKGRYITIRHPNRYISHYYHLSRVAKKIRTGVRVEQGQVIGYVGCTGLCTGPHLHYGIQKNGRFMNPLRLKSPTKDPVKKIYLEDFKHYTTRYFFVISGSKFIKIPQELRDVLLSPSPTPQIQTTAPLNL